MKSDIEKVIDGFKIARTIANTPQAVERVLEQALEAALRVKEKLHDK